MKNDINLRNKHKLRMLSNCPPEVLPLNPVSFFVIVGFLTCNPTNGRVLAFRHGTGHLRKEIVFENRVQMITVRKLPASEMLVRINHGNQSTDYDHLT